MAFPFGKSGMANPLDILVLRKERQNELFGRKIKTYPFDLRLKTEPSPISLISRYLL